MPVRLHEKILECEEPVVGLDYILELLPESDPEVHIIFFSDPGVHFNFYTLMMVEIQMWSRPRSNAFPA